MWGFKYLKHIFKLAILTAVLPYYLSVCQIFAIHGWDSTFLVKSSWYPEQLVLITKTSVLWGIFEMGTNPQWVIVDSNSHKLKLQQQQQLCWFISSQLAQPFWLFRVSTVSFDFLQFQEQPSPCVRPFGVLKYKKSKKLDLRKKIP